MSDLQRVLFNNKEEKIMKKNTENEIVGYLDILARQVRAINEENGWNLTTPEDWDNSYKFPAILALIHSEVSEALEAFRKDDFDNFMEEMGDVVIRVLDCIGAFDSCSFDRVIADKLEANKKRGYRHGGKRV